MQCVLDVLACTCVMLLAPSFDELFIRLLDRVHWHLACLGSDFQVTCGGVLIASYCNVVVASSAARWMLCSNCKNSTFETHVCSRMETKV